MKIYLPQKDKGQGMRQSQETEGEAEEKRGKGEEYGVFGVFVPRYKGLPLSREETGMAHREKGKPHVRMRHLILIGYVN